MNKIEKKLYSSRNSIEINNDLKKKLKEEFESKKTFGRNYFTLAGIAAAVLIVFTIYIFLPFAVIERVNAEALKISNYVSFLEIGGGEQLGIAEYGGKVYMPIFGKGLYVYDKVGFNKLLDRDINNIEISNDGRKLLFSSGGSIYIYDLETNVEINVLMGDNHFVTYEEPSWAADNANIIYTKKTIFPRDEHGFDAKNEIYKISLYDKNSSKITDGSYGNLLRDNNAIIFERGNKIIYKNLSDNSEKIIDDGRFPNVSPDGIYIAYVKSQIMKREVAENVFVEENIENVWIADTFDFTKKMVTSNYSNYFIDVNQWMKGIEASTTSQVLSITGKYSYYSPTWGSDSLSIYALKSLNSEDLSNMRLIRIDLDKSPLSEEDTIKKYIQALILRDDDYARSLMKVPKEILTISNPHTVGYRIIENGRMNDKDYIDADVYLSYTGNAYYQIQKMRYYFSNVEGIYKIEDTEVLKTTEVYLKNDVIYLDGDEVLNQSEFLNEIDTSGEISSLVYNQNNKELIFSIQTESNIQIYKFNLDSKVFHKIDQINSLDNYAIGVYGITLDSSEQNIAVDIYMQSGQDFINNSYIYSLDSNKKTDIKSYFNADIKSLRSEYWNNDRLVFSIIVNGQTVRYQINKDLSLNTIK